MLAEAAICVEVFLAMTQTKQVSLVDIKGDNLGKQLVQRLIAVCNEQRLLLWEIVIDVVDNLCRHVRLACPRRTNNDRQSGLRPRHDRFDLSRRKANRVQLRCIDKIGTIVGWLVRGHFECLNLSLEGRFSISASLLGYFPCLRLFRLRHFLQDIWRSEAAGYVVARLYDFSGKTFHEVLPVKKRVSVIKLLNAIGEILVVGACWVAVAQEDFVQPRWHWRPRQNQVADRLQYRLEVVLSAVSPEEDVGTPVHIWLSSCRPLGILVVGSRVKLELYSSLAIQVSRAFPSMTPSVIRDLHNLGSSDRHDAKLLGLGLDVSPVRDGLCWRWLNCEQKDDIVGS